MREGLIRLEIKCLFYLPFFFFFLYFFRYVYACKNSEVQWSLRNNGRKGSQESRSVNLYPVSPLLHTLAGQAFCILTAFLQHTSSHHTFPVAVLLEIEWDISLHNVLCFSYLQNLSSPSPHLFQLNLSAFVSPRIPLPPPPLF